MPKFIPGLTLHSFQDASVREHIVTEIPKLNLGEVLPDGSFDFSWKAIGNTVYQLWAWGNLSSSDSSKHTFSVGCSCPTFTQRVTTSVCAPHVCKHLQAALTSVINPVTKIKNNSMESTVKHQCNSKGNVVDLTLDDSDHDPIVTASISVAKNKVALMKDDLPASKRSKVNDPTICIAIPPKNNNNIRTSPIKLLCTVQDSLLRQQHDHNHWSWTQCCTLRELIFGNTARSSTIPIQWIAIVNYLIDFNFLLHEVPELRSIPHVVFFYGSSTDTSIWGTTSNHVDFVHLDPKDIPKSASNPLKYTFRSGTHHTKMFLIGYMDRIRVVVHTANLIHSDIYNKAQGAYIEEFCTKNVSTSRSSEYEDTLVHYFGSYGYNLSQSWLGDRSESLTDCLRRFDYSSANAVLIPSVPGYYELDGDIVVGHLKLKQAVSRYTVDRGESIHPIVCQFSSLGGMVSESYLRQLQASMDTRLSRQPYKEKDKNEIRLHFVYPTVKEICNSTEGIMGGQSVPVRRKNILKNFIRSRLRKWSSPTTLPSQQHPLPFNPLTKSQNVPHIKTYYQVSPSEDSMDWFVLTSHNMSTQAWGRIQTSKYSRDGKCHYVESWELGVFLSPALLGVEKLGHWSEVTGSGTVMIPIPYKVYLQDKYGDDDEPWCLEYLEA